MEPAVRKDLDCLDLNFKKKVEAFLEEVGSYVRITESGRTKERQEYLYASGRTRTGPIVTWTMESNHLIRGTGAKAIDICFIGTEPYPKDLEKWKQLGRIGNKYGMNRGGDRSTPDKPHFEENGKPYTNYLSPIQIIMNFYKKTWTDEYSKLTPEQRVFGHPDQAFDRIKGLPQDQQLEELIYLLAILAQKAK